MEERGKEGEEEREREEQTVGGRERGRVKMGDVYKAKVE